MNVINDGLCSACGGCAGICGESAIKMDRNPAGFLYARLDKEKCISCMKCTKVCPSNKENVSHVLPERWAEGEYLEAYVGFADAAHVREGSQSGGLVTALLSFMMDEGSIDGAVVTDYDITGQRPKSKYVTTKEALAHAAGSYYSQTPMVETYLHHKDKKCAVVALGCQSQSIKLAAENLKIPKPKMVLGLICGGQFSWNMTQDLIRQGGLRHRKLVRFLARKKNGEWPGNVYFKDSAGKEYTLPSKKRTRLRHYYMNYRCIQCFDYNNAYADIVFGDPWWLVGHWEMEKLKKGYTIALVRTKRGSELMHRAISAGAIQVEKIEAKKYLDFNNQSYCYPKTLYTQQVLNNLKQPNLYDGMGLRRKAGWVEEQSKRKETIQYYRHYNYFSFLNYKARSKEESRRLVQKEKIYQSILSMPDHIIGFYKRIFRFTKRILIRGGNFEAR